MKKFSWVGKAGELMKVSSSFTKAAERHLHLHFMGKGNIQHMRVGLFAVVTCTGSSDIVAAKVYTERIEPVARDSEFYAAVKNGRLGQVAGN